MPKESIARRGILALFVLGFIFALSSAIPSYITSDFLTGFIDESRVGIIYSLASLVGIVGFVSVIETLKKYGNFKVTTALLVVTVFSFAGFAYSNNLATAVFFFVLISVTNMLINFTIDMFLEHFSTNNDTGRIRGDYLALANIAWVISPIITYHPLLKDNARIIFLISAGLTIPVIMIVMSMFRDFKDPEYKPVPFWKSIGEAWTDVNIKSALMIHILLQTFYAWMIIYTPIYLSRYVGFGNETVSIFGAQVPAMMVITVFMLLPFVILDAPLGYLADKKYGEKEMLAIGFTVMGISTMLISLVTVKSVWIWCVVLFMTRVGAAMVEAMVDIYFFKKVDDSKVHLISLFRTARPVAYIISPIIGTILFTFAGIDALFITLGFIMFYGLRFSLILEDTK
jgi:MFS family permease